MIYRSNSNLLMLLSYYLEYYPLEPIHTSKYIQLAQEFIENNFSNTECNVNMVSDYIKIDRTYLYRLFKKELGKSVIDYINKCRISKAVNMLSDCSRSIKDIAYSVGYADQMYFSRVFKRLRGVSPSKFREYTNNKI